jgi:hypothetical protein
MDPKYPRSAFELPQVKLPPKTPILTFSFYNELWLVVNDLFFGIIVGALLLYNREAILLNVDRANQFLTNQILKALIAWLMGWPAGFKLNDELDEFLGVVFMFYIDRYINKNYGFVTS